MTIHFICTGNIYRSRLAEAYCASKGVPGLRVLSSGIATGLNQGIPIASYAERVLHQHHLQRFATRSWRQTTAELIQASDVVVFMEREQYHFCMAWLDLGRQAIEIWDIPDVSQVSPAERQQEAEQTFRLIRRRTDTMLAALRLL
jgi:protein-tyrosine-phosphatase